MPKISIKSHLKLLGIKKLKPKQKDIINLILKKKDIIGILPTGYGKSLCYILPYLIRKECYYNFTINFINERPNDKLKKKNISTLVFNSTFAKIRDMKNGNKLYFDLYNGNKNYLMYFSPESFIRNKFLFEQLIKKDLISLIAIDECHCVNNWSEFRTDYKELHVINDTRNQYNKHFSILCLTATATNKTQNKIKQIMNLTNPTLIKESSYKDNLQLFVKENI